MSFTTGMWRGWIPGVLCAAAAATPAAELTDAELRWLRAAAPVLAYGKAEGLPIDVVVQPHAAPGSAPLAMGLVDGRCKLVLSMRGNADAESALAGVDAALQPVVMEAIAAHEIAHCWRQVQGGWALGAPAEAESGGDAQSEHERWRAEMAATRREEGYADLVGLAWTLQRHPALYEQVHAWLEGVRAEQPVPASHHDTRVWVRLARDRAAFGDGATPFERAIVLWQRGLTGGAN